LSTFPGTAQARGHSPGPVEVGFGRKTTGWPSPRLLRPRSDAAFGIAFVARVAERLADMPGSVCIRFPGPRKGRAARWSALCPPPRPTGTWPTSSSAWTRAVRLPQHPDEYCAERPVLLAIDQELCEGPAVRVAPELADPVGAFEVGEGWAGPDRPASLTKFVVDAVLNVADDPVETLAKIVDLHVLPCHANREVGLDIAPLFLRLPHHR
jgi:hypothetical protein